MSEQKQTPNPRDRNGVVCPVCKKRSYSRGGVHPQCAMVQADEPRKLRLAAEKRANSKAKEANAAIARAAGSQS